MTQQNKSIIIIGASSGIGQYAARHFAELGWRVGIAARRTEPLAELASRYGGNVIYRSLDVSADGAAEQFRNFISECGGADIIVNAAGTGWHNPELNLKHELATDAVNVKGFMVIATESYKYFCGRACGGHLVNISSVAYTRGMSAAPAYSASKRYQTEYLSALRQLANAGKHKILITDIRPGFIDTPLLAGTHYLGTMSLEYAGKKIVKAICAKKKCVYVDWRWGLISRAWRLIPRMIWERLRVGI
ncbi:MAG: SDR family NAD(P)-dependent oxidoreductase [Muribaculaceae bacterium]|nr:SDR family NAD(P)-dependent oxidoreductase [Muribaculaceae bacterium]